MGILSTNKRGTLPSAWSARRVRTATRRWTVPTPWPCAGRRGSRHVRPRAKACIVLFMYGGPSQVDTWDPKPELTKRHGQPIPNLDSDPLLKVRNPGKLLASTRKFTPAGRSGIEVSDLFPNLARCI